MLDGHGVVLLPPDPQHRCRTRVDQFGVGLLAQLTDVVLAWLRAAVEHDDGGDIVALRAGQNPVAAGPADPDHGDRRPTVIRVKAADVRNRGVDMPQCGGVTDVRQPLVFARQVEVGIEVRCHRDETGRGELFGQLDRVLHDAVALVADDDDRRRRRHPGGRHGDPPVGDRSQRCQLIGRDPIGRSTRLGGPQGWHAVGLYTHAR